MEKEKIFRMAAAIHGDTIMQAAEKFGVKHPYVFRWFKEDISLNIEKKIISYVNEAIAIAKTIEPLKTPKNDVTPFSDQFVPPSHFKSRRARLADAQP
jgi:hypothetical protein